MGTSHSGCGGLKRTPGWSESHRRKCQMQCSPCWMMPRFVHTKLLTEALCKRFAPDKGEAELWFQLGQRVQKASETLVEFVDAALDLASRVYPEIEAPKDSRQRMAKSEAIRDGQDCSTENAGDDAQDSARSR